MTLWFQLLNSLIILALLGAPVVITILLLKRFGKTRNNEDYLLEKIRELEGKMKELEKKVNELYDFSE